jgi:hypothetical protein
MYRLWFLFRKVPYTGHRFYCDTYISNQYDNGVDILTIETLKETCPKLYKLLPEDISELSYLLIIDENYDDEESIAQMVLGSLEEILA